eukprot:TRINITY_DN4336_c0_g2_i3.p2 TRINITY_DN4336_c0_g2~~TRINITY_DN4336_c0_g2_i3.p2  ORF type:complete len:217 (-),score=33.71 TRINITY_DN4336_c0_g2_i3:347-997(-)
MMLQPRVLPIQKQFLHRPLSKPSFYLHNWRVNKFNLGQKNPVIPRRKITQCALLGVGAPEAILVAVVALIVFGPKGLAEAAKTLGQTLRSFQPTIRELTQVSSEIRNTLEEEIGLDEIRRDLQGYPIPKQPVSQQLDSKISNGTQATTQGSEELEDMRKASAQVAWGGKPPLNADTPVPTPQSEQSNQQISEDLSTYSLQDLEAELAKRKQQQQQN